MKNLFYTILMVFSFYSLLSADTLNVSSQYATIQLAINAATDGDVVLVSPGTYYENIKFKGKKITVASHYILNQDTSFKKNTIIDGSQHTNPDSGSVVYFSSSEDTNSVLYGFTIRGGTGTRSIYSGNFVERDGGGILLKYTGGKIEHNIITQNTLQSSINDQFGAGITAFADVGDHIIIRYNLIHNNDIRGSGRGWGAGAGLASRNIIQFENNVVHNNNIVYPLSHAIGAGIAVDGNFNSNGNNIISCNFITNNESSCTNNLNARGGGICVNYANADITNNVISLNVSEGIGGGITINQSDNTMPQIDLFLKNNTICYNDATYGGGLYIRGTYSHTIVENSILWYNSGSQIYGYSTNLTVTHSDVQDTLWTGTGNINADPLFADNLFHLSPGSPCIDAGAGNDDPEDPNNPGYAWWPAMGTLVTDMGGYGNCGGIRCLHMTAIDKDDDSGSITPHNIHLLQNYPNPFNPSTTIKYILQKSEKVKIEVFNLLGQKIATLLNEQMPAGPHEVVFTAKDIPSGVYLYRIEAGKYQEVKKMILLK